jgi:hypothetical protein
MLAPSLTLQDLISKLIGEKVEFPALFRDILGVVSSGGRSCGTVERVVKKS